MQYRREIDGLRAFAVVPVILFHAGFEIFSGGFVGVDIFFVISGYLITTILINELDQGKFSILKFYERRARRILPALTVVIVATLAFGWVATPPATLKEISESAIAVALFVSNFFFWKQSGYFERAAEEKPLLHTWSLAVEEQYYLFFPIMLLLLWRFGRNPVFYIIIGLTILSLFISELGWRRYPNPNFFLIFSRAWELFAGSICAFLLAYHQIRPNKFLALLGFIAILVAIFLFDEATPFPSLYAMVPVVGTSLLILFASPNNLTGKFLSMPIFVGIGLISYSAYLWHQPLLAFKHILHDKSYDIWLIPTLIGATFILAYISWRYIEQPFRHKDGWFTQKRIFSLSSLALIGVILLASIGILTKGGVYRYPSEDHSLLTMDRNEQSNYVGKRFNSLREMEFSSNPNTTKLLVIGDSYAQDLVNILYETVDLSQVEIATYHISKRCGNLYVKKNLSQIIAEKDQALCQSHERYNSEFIQSALPKSNVILLASSWLKWHLPHLPETIENISEKTDASLYIFGRKNLKSPKISKLLSLSEKERAALHFKTVTFNIDTNAEIKAFIPEGFISIQNAACETDEKCRIFDDQLNLISYDGSHLTKEGAIFIGTKLKDNSIYQNLLRDLGN